MHFELVGPKTHVSYPAMLLALLPLFPSGSALSDESSNKYITIDRDKQECSTKNTAGINFNDKDKQVLSELAKTKKGAPFFLPKRITVSCTAVGDLAFHDLDNSDQSEEAVEFFEELFECYSKLCGEGKR